MSGRLERVYQALMAMSGVNGVTAMALADAVGIDRSNASRELNRLVLTGRARKAPGKPVRFLAVREAAQPPTSYLEGLPELAGGPGQLAPARPAHTPLDGIPGALGSLKNAVALAKAAVMYPGGGLHTLILGQTGVGKSFFAEEMHRYAVATEVMARGAPFVVFNCADYASNPQLLMSQLFGAVKGAYTGAAADRSGVVEQAAGGILLLDEIHRLPPEGQEMLFILLDRGQLRRLGETTYRPVKVRVIAATTEDPESSLLSTFLRRIPMTIHLPALAERPAGERLDLILHCFQGECDRTGLPVAVSGRVISLLLRHAPRGNVGQLKADIQLICARAFLEEVRSPTGSLEIHEGLLPDLNLQPGPVTASPLTGPYRFVPGGTFEAGRSMGDSIYERIARRARELQAEGRAGESGALIWSEIDGYFAGITGDDPAWLHAVERLVGPQMLSWAQEMLSQARERLGLALTPAARAGLAMHIASTLERIRQGQSISYPRLREMRQRYPQEVAAAGAMAARLEKLSSVALPPDETGFLASFLLGLSGTDRGQLGVLVVCHGQQTASALVQTVRDLAGEGVRLSAVDWPLGEPFEQLLPRVEAELRRVDGGQGTLLLVDMGPLIALGELLTERTGIATRTVDMVSTPRLLEAVRKARAAGATLDELARQVAETPGYSAAAARAAMGGRPVLITLCLTGEGSARRLAAMLTQSLPELAAAGVEIVTGALAGDRSAAQVVAELARTRPVLAAVSTVDPGDLPVPVILLEEILMGAGVARIRHLLASARQVAQARQGPESAERSLLLSEMARTLAGQLAAVDPRPLVTAVGRALARVEDELGCAIGLDLFAGMAMHLACLVDGRVKSGEAPGRAGGALSPRAAAIGGALAELEQRYGVAVPESHLEKMALMIGG